MTEIHCIISGKVQRVAYRAYVQDAAMRLGVSGYVRNQIDGTVVVLAQGEPDLLKEFVEYLHEGSSLATVETVAVEWRTAKKHLNDFSVTY